MTSRSEEPGWVVREGTPSDLPRPMQIGCGLGLLAACLGLTAALVVLLRNDWARWPHGALFGVMLCISVWAVVRSWRIVAGRAPGDRSDLLSPPETRVFLLGWGLVCLVGVLAQGLGRAQPGWILATVAMIAGIAWAVMLWRAPLKQSEVSYHAVPGPELSRARPPAERLPVFKPFERQVLELLLGEHDAYRHLVAVIEEMEPESLAWTASGYLLTVTHPAIDIGGFEVLRDARVKGFADGLECEFGVQVEDTLGFECQVVDGHGTHGVMPEDFRSRDVRVRQTEEDHRKTRDGLRLPR